MEEQFLFMQQQLAKKGTGKGKGKGKGGKGKQVQQPQPSVSEACAQRLQAYVNDIGAPSSRSSTSLLTEDEDLPLRRRRNQAKTIRATTKTVYIKRIDCQINNNSVDQGIYI